ncbi:MAG: MATE family efflux transporter, partial [Lachnospiraceae bacterium]
MAAMLGGSISNIILDYVFIFPLKMGIFGAVFATGLAPVISILIMSIHFIKKKNGFHLAKVRYSLKAMKNVLALGLPSFITELSSGIVIIVFNSIILCLQGNLGVAAYGIIANISLVVTAIYTGIAQGAQPLISNSFGIGNYLSIKKLLRYSLSTMSIISLIIYLSIFIFSSPIVAIFNSENDIRLAEIASYGMKLYFSSILFMG